ncbi:MAG: hypothetical protein GXP13_06285 [Gammaproteobacteria bacterium]|nr:hypothetical protein [Gammaproteobacteria bacterium]
MSDTTPSNAQNPDLDWSQIRETIQMLNLAVAQIENAMREGDDSINTLTDSFTSMIGGSEVIRLAGEALDDGNEKKAILENCEEINKKMQSTIIAFQFYDKLSQRISHVSNSLSALSSLVGNPQQLYNPFEWKGLQEKIKSKYTIERDREMFDILLNGATVEEALQVTLEKSKQIDDGDIELF